MGADRISILIADDSKEDCFLMRQAFLDAQAPQPLEFVRDGQALLDALEARGSDGTLPGLILMDLNMPRLDGQGALKALRADPRFASIPVLIFSTSNFSEDVLSCYRLGANAVMVKPMDYEDFVQLVCVLKAFWLDFVLLPASFQKS